MTVMDIQKWQAMSWPQKMGNIGSEITRVRVWEEKGNQTEARQSLNRVLEMLRASVGNTETDLLQDIVVDMVKDGKQYQISLKELEEYCLPFALLARKNI